MYKKITHNIIEEHFDHPMAVEIKRGAGYDTKTTLDLSTRSASVFKDHVHRAFTKLDNRIRSYIISAISAGEDLPILEKYLIDDVGRIGYSIKTYFAPEDATAFNQSLTTLIVSVGNIVKAIKAGRDTKELRLTLANSLNDFATLLSSINPSHWEKTSVLSILSKLADTWISEAEARYKKEWAIDLAAADEAHNILVAGKPDGTRGFADIFANGIIKQFPQKFIA